MSLLSSLLMGVFLLPSSFCSLCLCGPRCHSNCSGLEIWYDYSCSSRLLLLCCQRCLFAVRCLYLCLCFGFEMGFSPVLCFSLFLVCRLCLFGVLCLFRLRGLGALTLQKCKSRRVFPRLRAGMRRNMKKDSEEQISQACTHIRG